jgi:hypothetical protein
MRPSYIPVMHCEKMAVIDMSFVNVSSLNINSAGIIYERLRGTYGGFRYEYQQCQKVGETF